MSMSVGSSVLSRGTAPPLIAVARKTARDWMTVDFLASAKPFP